jgi:hypothetical protein
LGLMADWEVWHGVIYKWNITVPGSYLTKVGLNRQGMQSNTWT